MSNKMKNAIGGYFNAFNLKERLAKVKFIYSIVSSMDNRQEIHVTYQLDIRAIGLLGKSFFTFKESEQCIIRTVAKVNVSDGSDSNEFSVYSVLLPEMERILKEHKDVWMGHMPKFGADCFITEDLLLLENLGKETHSIGEMDYDNAKVVLKKLAQFHATSTVYLKKFSADDVVSNDSPLLFDGEVESRIKDAINSIEEILPELQEIATKMRSYMKTFPKRITDLLDNRRTQFKVVALGDFTIQNMISIGEHGEADIVFSDFKSCFVGSCGYDLNFFFNTSLELNQLAAHRHDLLRFYYQHLTETLNILECPIPSWQTILDEVRELELVGLYALLCEMPFCCEEKNFRKRCMWKCRSEYLESFKEKYEVLLKKERVIKALKYGLYRFNDIRLWDNCADRADHNAELKDKTDFVMLQN